MDNSIIKRLITMRPLSEVELSIQIDKLFLRDRCPDCNIKRKAGWHENLQKVNIFDADRQDIWGALWHLMPFLYGYVEILKYILPRCLRDSFFQEVEEYSSGSYWSETRERTSYLCCAWKNEFTKEEREILNSVFWYGFKNDMSKRTGISPFYFTLFLLWDKKIPEALFLDDEEAKSYLYDFKVMGNALIECFSDAITNISCLKVLFGKYYYDDNIKPKKNREVMDYWNDEVITLPMDTICDILGRDNIVKLDKELLDFFEI